MSAGQDTGDYSLQDRKHASADPNTDIEASQKSTQGPGGISWVKTYGVAGLDTLATVDEPQRPASRDAILGERGYHVSVEHQR